MGKQHLLKIERAWDPPDWADLSFYGFYCLEAAIDAASIHLGSQVQAQHWSRVQAAEVLASQSGFPDIAELLRSLNEVRKSEAYGDVEAPDLVAEDVVTSIQSYLEEVTNLIEGR